MIPRLGPALGGTRMWPYKSESEALHDVLRLSRSMTYKAAITGLNLGGGKGVIIGDSRLHKSEALMRRYGRFIENLNGSFITAEEVGTNPQGYGIYPDGNKICYRRSRINWGQW
jgi:leucine dehydrogenase